jgi:hypothetical protein
MSAATSIEWTQFLCTKERARQLALPSSLTPSCDPWRQGS